MSRFIPRGVVVAPLARRCGAALIDAIPVAALLVATGLVLGSGQPLATVVLVTAIACFVLVGGYGVFQWWAYGTRGAGLGARALGLQLVGVDDGAPIGWWRWFIRQLVLAALMATVVGGIALLVFLVIHERRQGWHDLAARSIVVQPRSEGQRAGQQSRSGQAPSVVGLPPHLSSSFSPQVGRTDMGHAPAWMPRLESEPLISTRGQDPFSRTDARKAAGASLDNPPDRPQHQPTPTPARPVNQGWIPLPTPSSVIEPAKPAPRVRSRDFGGAEDLDGTRIAAPVGAAGGRAGHEGYYIRLDDGREVELGVPVLLGRNPQKSAEDPDVHLVPAGGDGRMISRTHVMVGTDARGVFAVDRGSTNGTALVTPGGGLEPCPVGTQVRVSEGQQVSYGNRWFTVLRRPERV